MVIVILIKFNELPFAVRFRFVVFRPFIDEIIVGRIRGSSADGVKGINRTMVKTSIISLI